MKLKYLIFFALFFAGCKVITPNGADNAWNGYNDECLSKPIQNKAWPIPKPAYYYLYTHLRKNPYIHSKPIIESGFVVLKSKDTIFGFIDNSLLNRTSIAILPDGKKTAADIKLLSNDDINYYRVYYDSANNKECYSDFVNLLAEYNIHSQQFKAPNQAIDLLGFWRLLGKKNDVEIFDDFGFSEQSNRPERKATAPNMILVSNQGCINIYQGSFLRNTRTSLKKFIGKRYNIKINHKDFTTIREMLDYILDKENEKQ